MALNARPASQSCCPFTATIVGAALAHGAIGDALWRFFLFFPSTVAIVMTLHFLARGQLLLLFLHKQKFLNMTAQQILVAVASK